MERLCCALKGKTLMSSTFDEFVAINTAYPNCRRVHREPPMYLIEDFLAPEECEALIASSEGRLQDAHVVGRGDGQVNSFGYRQGRTPGRTSRTCTLAKSEAEFLVSKAEVLIGKPRSHMELPQVGKYDQGQHYAPHFDAVEPTASAGRLFLQNGGQRVVTLLVYLNTPGAGGCTSFPSLDVVFTPAKGTALLFFPAFADGRLDARALHSAEPAVSTKWVSQVWVRQSGQRRDAEPSRRAAGKPQQAAPAESHESSPSSSDAEEPAELAQPAREREAARGDDGDVDSLSSLLAAARAGQDAGAPL